MAFPSIPTVAAGRVLSVLATSPSGTHTSPDLGSLTKNAGDLLIAIVITYDGNSTNAEFSSWGGSFTEFGDFATTTTMGIGCAYKWSTGSETGTFTVTSADTSTNDSAFFLLSIAGANGATPPEAGSYVTDTSAAADPGSFNPAGWGTEDTLWIAVCGVGEVSTTGSWTGAASAPANYGNYADTGLSADVAGAVEGAVAFRQLNAASEDVGAFSVDVTNARNAACVIAVRPPVVFNQSTDAILTTVATMTRAMVFGATLSVALSTVASISRDVAKTITAALTTAATQTKQATKTLAASLVTAATSAASIVYSRALDATLVLAASANKSIGKALTASPSVVASQQALRAVGQTLTAVLSTVASLVADLIPGGGGSPVSGDGADPGSPTAASFGAPRTRGGADPGSPG